MFSSGDSECFKKMTPMLPKGVQIQNIKKVYRKTGAAEREKTLVISLPRVRFDPGTQNRVCPAHTDVIAHTHACSLKRNEEKGLWGTWPAAFVCRNSAIALTHAAGRE